MLSKIIEVLDEMPVFGSSRTVAELIAGFCSSVAVPAAEEIMLLLTDSTKAACGVHLISRTFEVPVEALIFGSSRTVVTVVEVTDVTSVAVPAAEGMALLWSDSTVAVCGKCLLSKTFEVPVIQNL